MRESEPLLLGVRHGENATASLFCSHTKSTGSLRMYPTLDSSSRVATSSRLARSRAPRSGGILVFVEAISGLVAPGRSMFLLLIRMPHSSLLQKCSTRHTLLPSSFKSTSCARSTFSLQPCRRHSLPLPKGHPPAALYTINGLSSFTRVRLQKTCSLSSQTQVIALVHRLTVSTYVDGNAINLRKSSRNI